MAGLEINLTDLVLLAILLISGVLAFFRGFTREVLSILGWLGAIAATLKLFPLALPHVDRYLDPLLLAQTVTAVGLFLITLIALSILASLLARRIRNSHINALDRSLGFVFGLLRGAVLIALAYLVLVHFLPAEEEAQPRWVSEARALPLVQESAALLVSLAPENMRADLRHRLARVAGGARSAVEAGRRLKALEEALPSTDTPGETGYKGGDRKQLDRLFGSGARD